MNQLYLVTHLFSKFIKPVSFLGLLFLLSTSYGQCPAGLGTGVINVPSLPYSATAQTSCGSVDDLNATNTINCGSTTFLGGEDVVYVFTPNFTGQSTITVSSNGTNVALFLYAGCPLSGQGGTCLPAQTTNNGNLTMTPNLTSGTTYYLILDVTSTPTPACLSNYNISISSPPAPKDAGVNAIISPITNFCYSASENIVVQVKNFGTDTLKLSTDTLKLSWSVAGPNTANGLLTLDTGFIAPNATRNVTVQSGFNMSVNGNYTITASTIGTWDQIPGNNSLSRIFSPLGFITASSNPSTININTSTTLNGQSNLLNTLIITEVVQEKTGIGATTPYPSYITATVFDMVEITNIGSIGIDVSGYTLRYYFGTFLHHTFTFPANTIIAPGQVIVVGEGVGANIPPNFFRSGRTNSNPYNVNSAVGYVLSSPSQILDVVATAGYSFPAISNVTSFDWSGNLPSLSPNISGVRRTGLNDDNTSANWTLSSTTNTMNVGTLNTNITLITSPTIVWTGPGGFNQSGTSVTTPNLSPIGVYTYTATINALGCTFSDTANVNVIQPIAPVADFVANQTIIPSATTINFTDLSTNIPNTWLWSIAPATGWSFVAPTTNASQNPSVNFTTPGTYTVTLTSSNGGGTDTETKTAYIEVIPVYCASTGATGNNDIGNVKISVGSTNLLNNGNPTPILSNGTSSQQYSNFVYTVPHANLFKGTSYNFSVSQISNNNVFTTAYVNIFIDLNKDGQFNLPQERVLILGPTPAATATVTGSFTIPVTAIDGYTVMRVVLSAGTATTLAPCQSGYPNGETEDYLVKIGPSGPVDLTVSAITNPLPLECYSNAEPITVDVTNVGTGVINFATTPALLWWQVTGTNPQNGTFNVNTGVINPNQTISYTVTPNYNMAAGGTYNFRAAVTVAGDGNIPNDTTSTLTIVNTLITALPYTQNFNIFNPNTIYTTQSGFVATPDNTDQAYRWRVNQNATPTANTGPATGNGAITSRYFYTEADQGTLGSVATLMTPCINLGTLSSPALSFWYHKYGANMGNLYIDVYGNGGWVNNVDSIMGQTQTSTSQPWINRVVNLFQFAGETVKIRFRAIRGNGTLGDMAIDDIFIFNKNLDIAVQALLKPIAPVECRGATDSIIVRLRNDAFENLDLALNPVTLTTNISGSVNTNFTTQVNNGILTPLQTIDIVVSPNFNMSAPQSFYQFDIYTNLQGDTYRFNDSILNINAINPAPIVSATSSLAILCPDSVSQFNTDITTANLASYNVFTESFNAGAVGWGVTGAPATSQFNITNNFGGPGGTLNGSPFAMSNSTSNTTLVTFTSPIIGNATGHDTLRLRFQHRYQFATSGYARVEVFNGTTWVQVANFTASIGAWNNPNNQNINVTQHQNPNFRVRFTHSHGSTTQAFWAIDNVILDGKGPAVTFDWNPPAGLSNPTILNPIATPTVSTNYTLTVTDTTVGCSTIVQLPISVFNIQPIGLPSDTTICQGETIYLDANTNNNGYTTYQWNNGSIGQIITITANIAGSQDYFVYATQLNTCIASDTITVNVLPKPTVNLGQDRTICIGESIGLNGPVGMSGYLWNTGSTNDTIIIGPNAATQTYVLTVTDQAGCVGYDEVTIRVDPCTGIEEFANNISMMAYPNPNNGLFNLSIIGGENKSALIEIIDMQGRIVFTDNVSTTVEINKQIDLSNNSNGIYFVKVTSDNFIKTERIIIR